MVSLKNHMMVDLYGVMVTNAKSEDAMYKLLIWVNREIFEGNGVVQLTTVDKEPDNGISGIVNAPGGHFTIHTFTKYRTAYVDLFGWIDDDEMLRRDHRERVLTALKEQLGYYGKCDRRVDFTANAYGEHVIVEGPFMSLSLAAELVSQVMTKIGMKALATEVILLNGENNYDLVQPITTSHIAVHACKYLDKTIIDIFSCQKFDWAKLKELLEAWNIDATAARRVSRCIEEVRNP